MFLTLALFAGIGRVTAQSYGIIYNFTNGSDGAYPWAGLVISSNTLYGTTYNLFPPNIEYGTPGTVFKVNTDGSGFTPLHNFSPVSANGDGAFPQAGLVLSNNILYGTAGEGGTNGSGTIFKFNSDGTGFTTLHDFSAYNANATGLATNSEGTGPSDPLVLSGTTLYGTTSGGGTNGFGTVFAINIDGTGFRVLHHFTGSPSDGGHPFAGLVLAGNTLYGTSSGEAQNGSGSLDAGTVFAINTDSTGFLVLHSFTYAGGVAPSTGNSDGATPIGGLVLSGNTLYGTTESGGTNGYGTVFAVQTNGLGFVSLHTFSGGGDGAIPTDTLILSGNTLYGTTSYGGISSGYGYGGGGTVFAVNVNGSGFTTLHTFTGSPNDGSVAHDGLLLSGSTLYGTTIIGGSSNYGTIFGFSPSSQAPSITQQPSNLTVVVGSSITFNVGAIGTPSLSYQWQLDGANIAGATNSSYASYGPPMDPSQTPLDYDVVVTNVFGSVTSQVAVLIVDTPVNILVQPQGQTVSPGSNATFNVVVFGTPPFSYQWSYNGYPLATNAAGSNYTVLDAQFSAAGNYYVVITNVAGSATSQVAVLTVQDQFQPAIQAPSNLVVECTGHGGATVNFNVTATDLYDPSPTVTCTPTSGSTFPIGFTRVSCLATDHFGNSNEVFLIVQVTGQCDEGCIVLNAPSDMHVPLGQAPAVQVRFTATATNVCTGQPYPVFFTPYSGSAFPPGTNLVTCIATEGGASVSNTFAVIVDVTNGPTLQVPATITTTASTFGQGQLGATVPFQVSALVPYNTNLYGVHVTVYPPPCAVLPVGTNVMTATTWDDFGHTNITTFNIIVNAPGPPPPGPPGPQLCDYDWGFEETNTFGGWTLTYKQAGCTPLEPVIGDRLTVNRIDTLQQQMQNNIGGDYWQDLSYSVGQKGNGWCCTGWDSDSCSCSQPPPVPNNTIEVTLTSCTFEITNGYITFLIGGSLDRNCFVTLLVPGQSSPTPISFAGGFELMNRQWWDVSKWMGQIAEIEIVDNSPTGHINVDDFQFTDTAPTNQTVTLGTTTYPKVVQGTNGGYYDWDSPVWGFTDMHAHPLSFLGFGGEYFHGWPDGLAGTPNVGVMDDITNGLTDCEQWHGGWNLCSNPQGDGYRQLVEQVSDNLGNNPHGPGYDPEPMVEFRQWPVFNTLSHQQMWWSWIKRAYDGGERVMVALTDNNQLLAAITKGDATYHDDLAVGDLQIQALKEFVARHSDFMAIAYDPYQLRSIVRSNLMAIVIGTEHDDIGDLVGESMVSPTDVNPPGANLSYSQIQVTNAIWHLYTNGVRYVFTVHLADNKFGGTQAESDMLNVASKFLNNGAAISVENAVPADDIQFQMPNDEPSEGVLIAIDAFSAACIGALAAQVASIVSAFATGGLDAGVLATVDVLTADLATIAALTPVVDAFTGLSPGEALDVQTGAAYAGVLWPLVALGVASPSDLLSPFLSVVAGINSSDLTRILNANLLPLNNNYPTYPTCNGTNGTPIAPFGVRNVKGLSPLGLYAVQYMMSLGMVLDVDHMSQHSVDDTFGIATNVPGGYPLNSGHNGYRETGLSNTENSKSISQVATIQQLGGLLGVGWANNPGGTFGRQFSDVVPMPQYVRSSILNDCAGTSKGWAQGYLYALERSHGSNVTFGTDCSGFVALPGPRFGPQSALGLLTSSDPCGAYSNNVFVRSSQIEAQANGVLYTDHPLLTTPAFMGPATDYGTDPLNMAPFNIPGPGVDTSKGYEYNGEQADFYAALNIFYHFRDYVANGMASGTFTGSDLEALLRQTSLNLCDNLFPQYYENGAAVEGALSPDYEAATLGPNSCDNSRRRRIVEFAQGLLKGISFAGNNPWYAQDSVQEDNCYCTPWVVVAQQLGIAVYVTKVLNRPDIAMSEMAGYNGSCSPSPGPVSETEQWGTLLNVWDDYQKAFGNNVPMIPCQTAYKEWDINFEGVAHYGLFPDFLQDLKNIGLQFQDMNPIFRSAEGFATMWTKCMNASIYLGATPQIYAQTLPDSKHMSLSFTHGYHAWVIQENDDLQNPNGWHPADFSIEQSNIVTATVTIPVESCANCARYFRVGLSQ